MPIPCSAAQQQNKNAHSCSGGARVEQQRSEPMCIDAPACADAGASSSSECTDLPSDADAPSAKCIDSAFASASPPPAAGWAVWWRHHDGDPAAQQGRQVRHSVGWQAALPAILLVGANQRRQGDSSHRVGPAMHRRAAAEDAAVHGGRRQHDAAQRARRRLPAGPAGDGSVEGEGRLTHSPLLSALPSLRLAWAEGASRHHLRDHEMEVDQASTVRSGSAAMQT